MQRGRKRSRGGASDGSVEFDPLRHDPRTKALALRQPRNNEELYAYMKHVLGLTYATTPVVDGHQAPFDFFADVYFARSLSAMAIAARGAGKSYGLAGLHTLNLVTKAHYEITNVAAIWKQALNLYKYMREDFLALPYFIDEVDVLNQARTALANGSKLDITGGTLTAVSGPHPVMSSFDEVEFLDWNVLMQGISMAQSRNDYPSQNIFISTRQRIYGSMNRLSENAGKMGITEYKWAVWEAMERCPIPTQDSDAVLEECKKCPLLESCWSDAQRHDGVPRGKRSNGFMSYWDVVKRRLQMTDNQWDVQMECLTPSKAGLVYSEYNETAHIDKGFAIALPEPTESVYIAADWGFDPDPAVVLLIRRYKPGYAYVFKEFVFEGMTHEEVAWEVGEWCRQFDIRVGGGVVDSAEPAFVKALNKVFGARSIISCPDKSIENGITTVKWMLKPRSKDNSAIEPRLIIRPKHGKDDDYGCELLPWEFNQYHYPDRGDEIDFKSTRRNHLPVDANNHCFVAGTLVQTAQGARPIEDVKLGELVWTRSGLHPVVLTHRLEDQPVMEVSFSNGQSLVGTGNHPVWVKDVGFTPLDALRYGDIVDVWQANEYPQAPTSSGSRVSDTSAGLNPSATATTPTTAPLTVNGCTAPSGSPSTARSPKALTSITVTATASTTIPSTSNASAAASTPNATRMPSEIGGSREPKAALLTLSDHSPQRGTPARLGASGTASMDRLSLEPTFGCESGAPVSTAGRSTAWTNSPPGDPAPMPLTTAPTSARPLPAVLPAWTTRPELAPSAPSPSSAASTWAPELAPVTVVRSQWLGRASVHDLTVLGAHEYFANEILVHNCMDALRYYSHTFHGHDRRGLRTARDSMPFITAVKRKTPA